ncbi:MAG TPA: alpha/beta hydrolase [Cyanobacteria bacterium UBA8553]|nr:alpha/beta hydrolase [Cyanobacteria bacterium UBA8553]
MPISINLLFLLATTSYHLIATWTENRRHQPPGQLIDIKGYKLHLYSLGHGSITVVLDHSLGGIEGYFLVEEIAKTTRVCIYDRAGYGWSDSSPHPRTSKQIVKELDILLEKAGIEPPYILVGDSFGSYNVRLYAHQFPEKVAGLVLTDGLHEEAMLKMSLSLWALKLFFMSGFAMSQLGSVLGIVRLLGTVGMFELLKKELRNFPAETLQRVKRSFYNHQHWITMWREMWNLDVSGQQVRQASNLGNIPMISVKANTFFKPSVLNFYMPVKAANNLRDKMHTELLKLSTDCTQLQATQSGHFVWVDEPEVIVAAIQQVLQRLRDRTNS